NRRVAYRESKGAGADHRGRRFARDALGSANSRKQHHGRAGKREGKDGEGDGLEASVARRSSPRGQEPQAEYFLFQGRRQSSEQSDAAVYPLPQPSQPRGRF